MQNILSVFTISVFSLVGWVAGLGIFSKLQTLPRIWFVLSHYVLDVAIFGTLFFVYYKYFSHFSPFSTMAIAMDMDRRIGEMHRQAGRRDSVEKEIHQLRAGRPLEASQLRRQLGHLCVDLRGGAQGLEAGHPAAGRHRSASARQWLYRAV